MARSLLAKPSQGLLDTRETETCIAFFTVFVVPVLNI